MEVIRYLLLFQVFVAFFIAGGIFFKMLSLRSMTIAVLTALFGFHILLFLYGSGELVLIYPEFYLWFYFEVGLLFGPLLFIHMQCLLFDKKRLQWYDALHLLPIIIYWIGFGDVLLMPGPERLEYGRVHFIDRTMTWNYTLALQLGLYAVACTWLLVKNRSNLLQKDFRYALLLLISYITSTVIIVYLTHYADGWRDFAIYYMVLTMLIFGVGYLLYKDPEFLQQFRKKYFNSNLDKGKMDMIEKKIKKAFSEEKLFLLNSLSIDALAESLNEKPHHISQTFSSYVKENFNDYVNKHRVESAKKMLVDPAYDHLKIEAIALECGFNNKVTFYKAFTKFAKETPSKFRKEQR